jgi:hypothetical protein
VASEISLLSPAPLLFAELVQVVEHEVLHDDEQFAVHPEQDWVACSLHPVEHPFSQFSEQRNVHVEVHDVPQVLAHVAHSDVISLPEHAVLHDTLQVSLHSAEQSLQLFIFEPSQEPEQAILHAALQALVQPLQSLLSSLPPQLLKNAVGAAESINNGSTFFAVCLKKVLLLIISSFFIQIVLLFFCSYKIKHLIP